MRHKIIKFLCTLLVGFFTLSIVACDGWSLDRGDTNALYEAFISEIQSRNIDNFFYGESDGMQNYYLRVRYYEGDYQASEVSDEYTKYFLDGTYYTKDISTLITTKEEAAFTNLDYLEGYFVLEQLLMDMVNDDSFEDYVSRKDGYGTPWYNMLTLEMNNEALRDSGYITAAETMELSVYADSDLAVTEISLRIYDQVTLQNRFMSIFTWFETMEIEFPADLDSYGTTQTTETTN